MIKATYKNGLKIKYYPFLSKLFYNLITQRTKLLLSKQCPQEATKF